MPLSNVCEGLHIHCSLVDCECACHHAIADDYSGKTLGDVEIFLNGAPEPNITRIIVMDGARTVGAAQVIATRPKPGDRVTLIFRMNQTA